jgi:hypothetical protein
MRRRIVPTSGARSSPTRRPIATGSMRLSPSTLASPNKAANTSDSTKDRSE